jgi:hypothetical protein
MVGLVGGTRTWRETDDMSSNSSINAKSTVYCCSTVGRGLGPARIHAIFSTTMWPDLSVTSAGSHTRSMMLAFLSAGGTEKCTTPTRLEK